MLEPTRRYGKFFNNINLIYLKPVFNFIKIVITMSVKQFIQCKTRSLKEILKYLILEFFNYLFSLQLTKLTIIQIKIMRVVNLFLSFLTHAGRRQNHLEEVQNNSTQVALFEVSILISISNLSSLAIWILWLLNIENIDY